jgi:hypothetical protein
VSSARPAYDWRCQLVNTKNSSGVRAGSAIQCDGFWPWSMARRFDGNGNSTSPYSGIQREAIALCPIQLETDPVIGRSSFWGKNDWPAVQIFGHSEQL